MKKGYLQHLRRRNVNNSGITRDIEEVAARMIGHIEHLMESNTSKVCSLAQSLI